MSWSLLAAIPVFGLLILVHEFGHFITAKWAGIRVDEFAIGFPPRLLSVKRGETTYSLNALPIGGYVRMPGENGETTDENGRYDSHTFAAKPASKRAIVLLAGVTMNILLAIFCFTAAEIVGPVNFHLGGGNRPQRFAGRSGGHAAARPHHLHRWPFHLLVYRSHDRVGDATNAAPKDAKTVPIVVVVKRAGASAPITLHVDALVNPGPGQGHLGINSDDTQTYVTHVPLWQTPAKGVQDMGYVVKVTAQTLGQVIAGKLALSQAVHGASGHRHEYRRGGGILSRSSAGI